MTPDRNLLSYLPTALRNYPQYAATGSEQAHQALLDAGFPAGSEPTWAYSYRAFWDPFQRILREEIDPTYDGDRLAGYAFCASGTLDCDADYDLTTRPAEVKGALNRLSLTGRIGKPLLQLQGHPRHRGHPARHPALRRHDQEPGPRAPDEALRGRGRHPLRG